MVLVGRPLRVAMDAGRGVDDRFDKARRAHAKDACLLVIDPDSRTGVKGHWVVSPATITAHVGGYTIRRAASVAHLTPIVRLGPVPLPISPIPRSTGDPAESVDVREERDQKAFFVDDGQRACALVDHPLDGEG
jgi:hypothetical protein